MNILVSTHFSKQKNQIIIREEYDNETAEHSALEARKRALGIVRASAYAESEASIFKALTGLDRKGFGQIPKKTIEMAAMTLQLVRNERLALLPGINAIFGFETKQPLVEINIGSRRLTLYLDEAKSHAINLLQAAEAADTDMFLANIAGEDEEGRQVYAMLTEELKLYRQQSWLEDLFDS